MGVVVSLCSITSKLLATVPDSAMEMMLISFSFLVAKGEMTLISFSFIVLEGVAKGEIIFHSPFLYLRVWLKGKWPLFACAYPTLGKDVLIH